MFWICVFVFFLWIMLDCAWCYLKIALITFESLRISKDCKMEIGSNKTKLVEVRRFSYGSGRLPIADSEKWPLSLTDFIRGGTYFTEIRNCIILVGLLYSICFKNYKLKLHHSYKKKACTYPKTVHLIAFRNEELLSWSTSIYKFW